MLKVIEEPLESYLTDYYFNGMSIARCYDDGLWTPFDSEGATFSCFGFDSLENDFA